MHRGKEYKRQGSFLYWFVGLIMSVQNHFCFALAAPVDPAQIFFPLTVHYFKSFVPIAQQAGQAVELGRLPLKMCL